MSARFLLLLCLASLAVVEPAAAEVRVGAQVTVTGPPPPPRYRRRPGPRYMLPLQIKIGALGTGSDRGGLAGAEAQIGVHWASLSPQPTNFDIGLGVVAGVMGPTNGDEGAATPDDDNVEFAGPYLEIAQTLSHGDFWRTWVAGRGEYLDAKVFGDERRALGVAARVSAELFLSGVGIEPRGVFFGTYAIGVYLEAAGRDLGDTVAPLHVSGGLTFRTPLVWGW